MRGAPSVALLFGHNHRIIPADAGSTGCSTSKSVAGRDHPRGCGEHLTGYKDQLGFEGSSPRMRGARSFSYTCFAFLRIIPADAGSTDAESRYSVTARDHPRGCGEHPLSTYIWTMILGSSPRMRGARSRVWWWIRWCRIIPADAGSTPAGPTGRRNTGDHPRGCGEHRPPELESAPGTGSSPRMRGARMHTVTEAR